MKKLTALLLIVISIACIFSGCGNTLKFDDEKAMYDYLQGIWEYKDEEYFVFNDESIYFFIDGHCRSYFNEAFLNAWNSGGESAFNALTYEEVINDANFEEISLKYNDVTCTPEKGIIDLGERVENAGAFKIEKDSVKYKEHSEDEYTTLTKIADEFDFSKLESIKEFFEELKNDYKLPVDDFLPDTKEYAEKLKKVFPDISKWELAHDAETSTIYSDTGSTTDYNEVILISEKNVSLFKENNTLQIMYIPENNTLTLIDKNNTNLNKLLKAAAAFVEDYPKAMDMNEFLKQFEANHTVSSGQKTYESTVDGITYKIQRPNGSGSTMMWISH